MRYLKSLLFIGLLSICAFQANANVSTFTTIEEVVPPGVIDVVIEGRIVIIRNTSAAHVVTFVSNSEGQIVHETIIGSYTTIKLSDLSSGVYKITAIVPTTGREVSNTIIIK